MIPYRYHWQLDASQYLHTSQLLLQHLDCEWHKSKVSSWGSESVWACTHTLPICHICCDYHKSPANLKPWNYGVHRISATKCCMCVYWNNRFHFFFNLLSKWCKHFKSSSYIAWPNRFALCFQRTSYHQRAVYERILIDCPRKLIIYYLSSSIRWPSYLKIFLMWSIYKLLG